MASEREIKELSARLVKAFNLRPDPQAFSDFMEIVVEKMKPFPTVIVQRGVEQIIETNSFFPKISELLRACWKERDDEMQKLNNRWQQYKTDWYADRMHTKAEWELLAGEYKKMNASGSAKDIMRDFEQYGKPFEKVDPAKVAEGKKLVNALAEKLDVAHG